MIYGCIHSVASAKQSEAQQLAKLNLGFYSLAVPPS